MEGVLSATSWFGGEEVGVQRNNDIGRFEVVLDVDITAKGQLRSGAHVIAVYGLVLVPLRSGVARQDALNQAGQRGRGHAFGQDAQSGTAALEVLKPGRQVREKSVPCADLAGAREGLGAVRIVERQDRRLGEHVGGAAAGGMVGIAFHLDRTAFVALDDQSHAVASRLHRGGEK
jgi:hypothetical protein